MKYRPKSFCHSGSPSPSTSILQTSVTTLVQMLTCLGVVFCGSAVAGGAEASEDAKDGSAIHAVSAEETLPEVEEVLTAHLRALGGQAAVQRITGLSRSGDLVFESPYTGVLEGRLNLDIVPKKKIYRAAELGAFSTTTAWDGEVGWETGPQGKRVLEGQELQMLAEQSDLFFTTGLGRAQGTTVELVKRELLDDAPHYVLSFEGEGQSTVEVYLHAETLLVSQILIPMSLPGLGEVVTISDFWDYQDHEGVMLPNSVSSAIEGVFAIETQFTETTINGAIDDELFTMPR